MPRDTSGDEPDDIERRVRELLASDAFRHAVLAQRGGEVVAAPKAMCDWERAT